MKRNYYVCIVALLATFIFAQTLKAQRTCAAHDHMLHQHQKSPKMKKKAAELEDFTKRYIKDYSRFKATESRTIPVYVHVIYRTAQENISDAQIQSQISVLNKDYGGTNPDISLVPGEFTAVTSSNTGIQFVLAGIDRTYSSKTSWGTNDAMKLPSQGGVAPITPETHLNMWICNIGGGILGYAQFPGGDPATDGVVFSPQYCGSIEYDDGSFYLDAPFNKGRTATHEVGHYLNLRHIWGDGNCNATDYVDDTPSAEAANYSCPTYPHYTCNSNDMFMNYMDYVDDECMYMFSQGQEARMWACLNSTRANLGSSGGNVAPVASINGPYSGEANVAINFSSAGSNDADGSITAYAWEFGDGSTSSSANPAHTYTSDGIYTVSLTVTDNEGATGVATTTVSIGCAGIASCNGNVSLTLVTDKYASETSWTLTDADNVVVEQNGSLSNSSTYNLDWNLAPGTYTFTINDSYGDGICCSYGNGSYTLTDGCSNTLATGGSFGTTESVIICVPEGGTPINTPPVAEANGPYNGVENASITFSSAGSNDSDGSITSYLWDFGDGVTSSLANPTHTYTNQGTYTVSLTVTDDDGATGTDNTTVTVDASGSGGEVVLSESYFETGWDGWIDGGGDASRYSGSRSYEGNYSILLRDNSGAASAMSLTSQDISGYDQIIVDFYFYPYSMETGEDFYVGIFNGSSWEVIGQYISGTNFNNGSFYHAEIVLNSSDYNFASNGGFIFQCDASSNSDNIYIDAVIIKGVTNSSKVAGSTIRKVEDLANVKIRDAWNEDLVVFPNPVGDVLNINVNIESRTIAEIYNLSGALVKSQELESEKSELEVSELKGGVYILKISNQEGNFSKKFVKK